MRMLSNVIYPLLAIVCAVSLWYAIVIFFHVPKYILPLPEDVYNRIVENFCLSALALGRNTL